MFKFNIGNKAPEFGDSYFPCPKCLGQTVYTEKGGHCWDCSATFRVEFTGESPERQNAPVRPELILLGLLGIIFLVTSRPRNKR